MPKADEYRPQLVKHIEGSGDRDFYPPDTIDTQNPIPYIYGSVEDFKKYVVLAKNATFGSLYTLVRECFIKYVNVEDYYADILAADVVYSYFQDKFSETHYNIFVGDNGSGKNSALLFFRLVAYRVFYNIAMSAANYYTFLGDTEECQGCIAEDEAQDMAYDGEKQKIIKGGYCSGATVPKTDLTFGRKQENWLTYCHKWFAMEELADYKNMKGVLDRSFVYNFVIGEVDYNIKHVMRHGGDPKYKELRDELDHIRKLLFAFRLVRYDDVIPRIKLNVRHESNSTRNYPSICLDFSATETMHRKQLKRYGWAYRNFCLVGMKLKGIPWKQSYLRQLKVYAMLKIRSVRLVRLMSLRTS